MSEPSALHRQKLSPPAPCEPESAHLPPVQDVGQSLHDDRGDARTVASARPSPRPSSVRRSRTRRACAGEYGSVGSPASSRRMLSCGVLGLPDRELGEHGQHALRSRVAKLRDVAEHVGGIEALGLEVGGRRSGARTSRVETPNARRAGPLLHRRPRPARSTGTSRTVLEYHGIVGDALDHRPHVDVDIPSCSRRLRAFSRCGAGRSKSICAPTLDETDSQVARVQTDLSSALGQQLADRADDLDSCRAAAAHGHRQCFADAARSLAVVPPA